MVRDMLITEMSIMDFISQGYSYVLEYSADCHRARLHDEDGDDAPLYVPVAFVRNLIAAGRIKVWRYNGQWNRGYHTYKPTWWVEAWVREYGPITVESEAIR